MSIIKAIIFGIVQGITEFLPVSSSGHLVLLSKIMKTDTPGLSFEIMLHVATLFAVVIVFRKDVLKIIRNPFTRLGLIIAISTAATAAVYIIFKSTFEGMFETGRYIGYGLLFTGTVLYISDSIKLKGVQKKEPEKFSATDAVIIGLAQGIAIAPGISRSGATIASGLMRNAEKGMAVRFSFLLSIPAILGALLIDIIHMAGGETVFEMNLLPLLCAFAAAFISGYIAVKFLMRFIMKKGLRPFAYYVFTIAALVLLDQYIFKIFM